MDSETITWIGTILTAIGTGVTLWQAAKVKKYKEQVAFDLRKISIAEAGELLRRGQEDCRKLLTSGSRGQSNATICSSVQEKLDYSLNRFSQKNEDQDIKDKLTKANQALHNVRNNISISQNASDLHSIIQQAITLCNERISEIN